MLSNWLKWKAPDSKLYENFDLVDIDEKTEIDQNIKPYLEKLLLKARFNTSVFQSLANQLEWFEVEKFLAESMPSIPTARRGFFGEVLTCALLVEFFGYVIPVQKLQYTISANRSLPGTDAIAIKKSGKTISEVCFVESKLRTTNETSASIQGYRQLREDYSEKIPEMILFTLSRLQETNDPLFDDFLRYTVDRHDLTYIESFCLGLTWEKGAWTEKVLENLEDDIDRDFPPLSVKLIRIENLAETIKDVFETIGVSELVDNE